MQPIKISLADLIKVVIGVASVVGTWYHLQGKIERLEEKVSGLEKVNTEVLDERVRSLQKDMDKISKQTDEIYRALMSNE